MYEGVIKYLKYTAKFFLQARDIIRYTKGKSFDLCVINVAVLLWPLLVLGYKKYNIVLLVKEHIQPGAIRKLVYKLASKRVKYIITNSELLAREMRNEISFKNIDTVYSIIGDSIESESDLVKKISPEIFKIISSDRYFKIINVGGISPRKNQLLIAETVRNLITEDSLSKILFVHIGKLALNEVYGRKFNEYIIKNHLRENFVSLGELNHAELYELYRFMDIMIVSSLSEGIPLVLVESLKNGKPLITTKVGGIEEIILDRINGLLINPNVKEMRDAILSLHDDPKLFAAISENAKVTYSDKFDYDKNMNKLEKLFCIALNKN